MINYMIKPLIFLIGQKYIRFRNTKIYKQFNKDKKIENYIIYILLYNPMFSVLLNHKKLSYIPTDNKCFPPYYKDDWNFYFDQCLAISHFSVKFDV